MYVTELPEHQEATKNIVNFAKDKRHCQWPIEL